MRKDNLLKIAPIGSSSPCTNRLFIVKPPACKATTDSGIPMLIIVTAVDASKDIVGK